MDSLVKCGLIKFIDLDLDLVQATNYSIDVQHLDDELNSQSHSLQKQAL